MFRFSAALCVASLVGGCNAPAPDSAHNAQSPVEHATEAHSDAQIALTDAQIAASGITLAQLGRRGPAATTEVPAILESDPDRTRVVAAPVSGRIVALTRNLGDRVAPGQALAILESREAAALHAEIEQTRSRVQLAQATLNRDEALYARGFRPLREVEISRAAAREAEVALRLARQQASASGVRTGSLNRIAITAPIGGSVIGRRAILGQTFAADAADTEMFRIADLARLSVTFSLPAAEAAQLSRGADVKITAGDRTQQAKIRFIAAALDAETQLVRVIADLDNRASRWRVGEPVQARVALTGEAGADEALMIPAAAIQTVDNRSVVFVRSDSGFRVVPVTLGRRDGPMIAVARGLTGDETIAATNTFILKAERGKGEAEQGGH